MAAQLTIIEPSGRRRIVPLKKGSSISIGRGTGNGIIVFDPEISRVHCTITWGDSGVIVEDNASQNGTLLNGQPVRTPLPVRDNDEIQVGHCKVKFLTLWEGKGVIREGQIPSRVLSACTVAVMIAAGAAIGFFSDSLVSHMSTSGVPPAEADGGPTVKSNPAGAMVFLNDAYVGTAPVKVVREKGLYSLRVTLAGYTPCSKAIRINGTPEELALELQPIEPARIEVASEPSDAEIILDGSPAGKTPITLKTAPGTHEIVLQKTNYVPWNGTVEVEPGKTLKVAEGMESRNVVAYLKQIEEDPNNVSYYTELGHVYILEKRWAEAYDVLRKGMETFCMGRDTSNYAGRLKWLFDKIYFGDYFDVADKAKHEEIRQWIVSLYGEMIKKYPAQKANLLAWLTELLKRAGKVDDLNKVIEQAMGEPNLEIYFQAADLYLEKGKFQRAVGILSKAVNLGPKSFKAHCKLGEACMLWCKNGKKEAKEDAVKNLENAAQLCNDNVEKQKIQALLQEAMKLQ